MSRLGFLEILISMEAFFAYSSRFQPLFPSFMSPSSFLRMTREDYSEIEPHGVTVSGEVSHCGRFDLVRGEMSINTVLGKIYRSEFWC